MTVSMKAYNLSKLSEAFGARMGAEIPTTIPGVLGSQKEIGRHPYKKRWSVDTVKLTC